MRVVVRDPEVRDTVRGHLPILFFFWIVAPGAVFIFRGGNAALTSLPFSAGITGFFILWWAILLWPTVLSAEVDRVGVRGRRLGRRWFAFTWGEVTRASPATSTVGLLLWVPGYRGRFVISNELPEIDSVMALAREGIAADRWQPVKTARSSESSASD